MTVRRAAEPPTLFRDTVQQVVPIRRSARPHRSAGVARETAPCSLCGYVRTFRRGVCRTCHRKLSDGGLEQLPDLRGRSALAWLTRREFLLAWRSTLAPEIDRLLVEVFATPLARPTDALSKITTPTPAAPAREEQSP